MSALPPPPPPPLLLLLLALLAAPAALARRAESASASQPEAEHQPPPGPGNATQLGSGMAGGGSSNSSVDAVVTRISSLLRDLPTLKATVIVACAFSALLIACLLLRVFRWVASPNSLPCWLHGRRHHAAAAADATARPPHLRAQVLALGALSPGAHLSALCLGGIRRAGTCIWFFQGTSQEPFPPLRLFGVFQVLDSIAFLCSRLTPTLSSDHLPWNVFLCPLHRQGNIQRELAYTGTQRLRDNLD